MKIRHNLRVLMAKRRVKSIKQLSEDTGIDYAVLIQFNNYRQRKIDPVVVTKLCEYFGCTLKDFLYIYEGNDGTDDGFPREKHCS
ncbi:helix-turn-helix domain-containing protein [Bacillus solitudinis]|uniref:helix-turn-helix domain-containing protein n=1 Tax=Bacillus solitudinis TaxID=2014074 RepID=UPI000C2499B4|nr:helix-turn-helix transcriptional regulator [Bacillus solitudinis]